MLQFKTGSIHLSFLSNGSGLRARLSEEIVLPAKPAAQQAPRVDRPPTTLCCATLGSLPATQGQRYADVAPLKWL
jgi:hypothetical protein